METRHTSDPEERLAIGEAARLAGVAVETLRRWADDGRLESHRIGPGGHRRFRRGDIENLAKKSA